jgi:hypothetical protein
VIATRNSLSFTSAGTPTFMSSPVVRRPGGPQPGLTQKFPANTQGTRLGTLG